MFCRAAERSLTSAKDSQAIYFAEKKRIRRGSFILRRDDRLRDEYRDFHWLDGGCEMMRSFNSAEKKFLLRLME